MVQYATRVNGNTAVKTTEGQRALIQALLDVLDCLPAERPAVATHKKLHGKVIEAGIPADRVAAFGNQRGQNKIEDADVMIMLGRPQAPDAEALQLAQALYAGERPISPHMTLRCDQYHGYRDEDGIGRCVDVSHFEDERVDTFHRATREDEFYQSVHRARPLRVGSGQGAMNREALMIVLVTSQPVPGLRVDELHFEPTEAGDDERDARLADANQQRKDEARDRIAMACELIKDRGDVPSVNGVAREAKSHSGTVRSVLPKVSEGSCERASPVA